MFGFFLTSKCPKPIFISVSQITQRFYYKHFACETFPSPLPGGWKQFLWGCEKRRGFLVHWWLFIKVLWTPFDRSQVIWRVQRFKKNGAGGRRRNFKAKRRHQMFCQNLSHTHQLDWFRGSALTRHPHMHAHTHTHTWKSQTCRLDVGRTQDNESTYLFGSLWMRHTLRFYCWTTASLKQAQRTDTFLRVTVSLDWQSCFQVRKLHPFHTLRFNGESSFPIKMNVNAINRFQPPPENDNKFSNVPPNKIFWASIQWTLCFSFWCARLGHRAPNNTDKRAFRRVSQLTP